MPTCPPPTKVLVTGATGFVGSWTCQTLLDAGYHVRAVVRSQAKGEYLRNLFSKYGDRFEYVVVPDMRKPGAYDDAVDPAVGAIVHTADVIDFSNQEDWRSKSVDATQHLLDSARKNGKSLKRFVYMSSCMALVDSKKPLTYIYHDDDWNDTAVEEVTQNEAQANGLTKYQAGKVLSERLALGYPASHGLGWDVVSFIPAWVYGPVLQQDISGSPLRLLDHMTKPRDKSQVSGFTGYADDFVDVRDVADAIVTSLKVDKAGGERFILDAGAFTFQNLYDALQGEPGVQVGDPAAEKFAFPGAFCDSSKAKTLLGITFRDLRTTAKDAAKSYRERGLLKQ